MAQESVLQPTYFEALFSQTTLTSWYLIRRGNLLENSDEKHLEWWDTSLLTSKDSMATKVLKELYLSLIIELYLSLIIELYSCPEHPRDSQSWLWFPILPTFSQFMNRFHKVPQIFNQKVKFLQKERQILNNLELNLKCDYLKDAVAEQLVDRFLVRSSINLPHFKNEKIQVKS